MLFDVLTQDNPCTLDQCLAKTREAKAMMPFSALTLEFCQTLSTTIFARPEHKNHPDLAALAFWLRKANITQLAKLMPDNPSFVPVPLGTVLHFAPKNVDTIFVYSWICSFLCGNRNIIRISDSSRTRIAPLIDIIRLLFKDDRFKHLADSQFVVSYPHSDEISQKLCDQTDLRVIWGGDSTIQAIRKYSLPAHARDLPFHDRSSLSIVNAEAFLALSPTDRENLGLSFYRDASLFDQKACSSPGMIIFVGPKPVAKEALSVFGHILRHQYNKNHATSETGSYLDQLNFAFTLASEDRIASCRIQEKDPFIIELNDARDFVRDHPGAGIFQMATMESLCDLPQSVQRKDQTLSHFGFKHEELRSLTHELLDRGIDRMVPFGKALDFGVVWDGKNLFHEFTKLLGIGT